MTSNHRDDFSESTKRTLAERVGWKCSFPKCNQSTVGPASNDTSKKINNGIAAHICAASRNGPRYDPLMTPEERKSIDNGIWMCRNHGNLIDADESNYTVEQLRQWKIEAENLAYDALLGKSEYGVEQDLYEENVYKHRVGFGRHFKNINVFKLYYSIRKKEFVLQGFDAVDLTIDEESIYVAFNQHPQHRIRIEDHEYLNRVEVDFFEYIDDVVRLFEPHETVQYFSFYYKINDWFSTATQTTEAYYCGDFNIQSGIIYDDLERRISPRDEELYNKILTRLSDLKNITKKFVD